MVDWVLGMNAKLYWAAAATPAPDVGDMDEVSNVRDLTVGLDAAKADVTTRANAGWKASAPTLRSCKLDFEMLWKPGDTAFDALLAAFLAGGVVHLAALDNTNATVGAQGPKADFCITGFAREEKLEDAIKVKVTAEPAGVLAWEEVSA